MTPRALRIRLRQRLRRTGNAPYLLDASTLLQNALEQHLIELVEAGVVSKEEAIAHANDANVVGRLD
jgi:Tfp pilus assembly ATPase PilU